MADMGSNQSHAESVNLLQECLEALMFCDPCLDIHDQVFGNMDRARLATVLIREPLGVMERSAALTAAGGAATAHGDDATGSSQNRAVAGQFLETAVQHAADEGRVLWNAHRCLRAHSEGSEGR
jgi:hypothetical protein